MPVMMMPVVACGCGWCRAEQVIQDVNDGANVPLRPTVSVLEGWVQSAAERAGIHALAVMMHTLYYRALPASRVLLRGELLQLLREVSRRLGERPGVEGGGLGRRLLQHQRRGARWALRIRLLVLTPRGVHATGGNGRRRLAVMVVAAAELLPGQRRVVGRRRLQGGLLLNRGRTRTEGRGRRGGGNAGQARSVPRMMMMMVMVMVIMVAVVMTVVMAVMMMMVVIERAGLTRAGRIAVRRWHAVRIATRGL